MITDSTIRELVDISNLSILMKEMYNNKELRKKCSENCLDFVEPHTWNAIAKKWDKLITEMK